MILSDEEEEVKMIEEISKKKWEPHQKTELEELEQMIENKNKEDRTHGRSVSNQIPKNMSDNDFDEEVIKWIEDFGYPYNFTQGSLIENKLNYATASYYLYTIH